MSRETFKSMSDKEDNESDDSDSSIESISSSWNIEPEVEKCKTSPCSPKVIGFSDSSSECSDGTYEAKVLSYLSGISIQENIKTEKKSFFIPKKEVDNATSSSWESDSSLEPSFRYSSKTLAKKKIWETLEKSMEEDRKIRRTKKLKKKTQSQTSPEKVPSEVYFDAGLKRNVPMQQIQIAHLSKRQQKNGQILVKNSLNPTVNVNPDLESSISEWFCEICNLNFETESLMSSHMVNKHEGFVNFICQNCAHPFYDATLYNSHYQKEHSDKTNTVFCYLCKEVEFPNFATLLDHLKKYHVTTDLYQVKCQQCSDVFLSHEVLSRHYCENLKVCHQNLIPRYIDKPTKIKLEDRGQNHSNKIVSKQALVLECEKCGSIFKRSKYLRQHLAVHHRVLDVFECYICRKTFGANYKLVEHFKIVHSGTNFKCGVCGKSFQSRFTLGTHMKKHSGDFDVFICMYCSQVFNRKQLMIDHVGDMNRKCLWCGMALGCRTKLLEHIDEKHRSFGRLECTECRRDVHSLTKFWNHLIVYHPEQCRLVNKNCVVCEKCRHLCSSRLHLKKHQRKLCLVSEKNVCKYCNIRFGSNYLNTVHLKKVLRCAMCGERFECLTLLKEHIYFGDLGCRTTGYTVSNNERLSNTSKISNRCDENSKETISNNVEIASTESIKSGCSPSKSVLSSQIFSSSDGEVSFVSDNYSSVRECSLISNNYTKTSDCERGEYRNMSELSIDTSTKLYKYKCYDCDSYYKKLQDLECHRRLAHDSDDNSPHFMICDHCGKQFLKRSILEGHFKKINCSICESKFHCWSLLSSHCTSQHKIGEWTCNKCNRSFRTSLTLVKHSRNCLGIDVKKHRRKRKFVENLEGKKFVKHPKYKRIRILDNENDEFCDTDLSISGVSLKNTSRFRIVLKKQPKKVSPSKFNGSLRKSPRKLGKLSPTKNSTGEDIVKPSKKNFRTIPDEKNCYDFLKSFRKAIEATPLIKENDSKFVSRNCESSPEAGGSIEDDVLKPIRKNGELSSDEGDFIESNVSKYFKMNYESPTDKKLKIRNGVLESKRKLDYSSPKKHFTKIEDRNLKYVSKIDELSPEKNLLECDDDLKPVRKLNNLYPKKNFIGNFHMKPLDGSLETSKDLIIDTSVSYCQSDNNDCYTKNEESKSLSDSIPNTDQNHIEVTRTDFFLNLDLVSSTPIDSRRKISDDLFHEKQGFGEKLNGSESGDNILKDTNFLCRKLNFRDPNKSKIVNFEASPNRMPTSILKTVSSVKSNSSSKRIVHFEDDVDSWKFLSCHSPDSDSSRSFVEIPPAKNDSCISSSSMCSTLKQHTKSGNRSQIYHCRLCKKRFPSKDLLQCHVSSNVCMVKIPNLT